MHIAINQNLSKNFAWIKEKKSFITYEFFLKNGFFYNYCQTFLIMKLSFHSQSYFARSQLVKLFDNYY